MTILCRTSSEGQESSSSRDDADDEVHPGVRVDFEGVEVVFGEEDEVGDFAHAHALESRRVLLEISRDEPGLDGRLGRGAAQDLGAVAVPLVLAEHLVVGPRGRAARPRGPWAQELRGERPRAVDRRGGLDGGGVAARQTREAAAAAVSSSSSGGRQRVGPWPAREDVAAGVRDEPVERPAVDGGCSGEVFRRRAGAPPRGPRPSQRRGRTARAARRRVRRRRRPTAIEEAEQRLVEPQCTTTPSVVVRGALFAEPVPVGAPPSRRRTPRGAAAPGCRGKRRRRHGPVVHRGRRRHALLCSPVC
mmetsp:Transcript_22863/g.90673  ORF Transcript_22863/g.90673 Transcript_22863/m.90673 type:complete len:304 (+) Transcript_22863:1410-2321(+)